MWMQRTKEALAMLMVGDGLLAMTEPHRHCLLWKAGPRLWQEAVETFVEHPNITRALGAVELSLGFWLASRQEPDQASVLPRRTAASMRSAARRAVGV